ncbi:hypothetical protein N7G274_000275 [Stereocaulon virgatum]|uniref:Uncharacterized protein n=1 Tax=Stereocaulon virgatum TaxID=373712 RepID=A0ABR4AUR3_9LECA
MKNLNTITFPSSTMPTDPIRTTRSGRVCKQTSRPSLAEHRPATTSTSRSRNRDASANTLSTRKKGQASTSSSYNPTRAALLEELLEQERQKAQQPEEPGKLRAQTRAEAERAEMKNLTSKGGR